MLRDVQNTLEITAPGAQSISQTITVNGEPETITTLRWRSELGELGEQAWLDRHDRIVAKARKRGGR